jgi:DNA repair exonuclease SbcCD ATPase subunit
VINSRFLSIQNRVNYYLELLGTPFRARVQEGLSFSCQFPGREIDSQELSGGEKVDLSISFRLAACESFCSNAGFIVLDEPTTWLDENTKHEMINVLDRLNELGRANNFQFLIPTHERMLLDHFDQVIEL